ncbi:MAG: PIN domain-containing protein [Gammaproteobacteria bacterium]
MKCVELVVDTDVASFIFKDGERGAAYSELIGERCAGVTLLSIADLRAGVVRKNWGPRKIASLDEFLSRFLVIETSSEIANIGGGIRACCEQVGRAVSWPDAWIAATALWLDVPLVAHDRDLEGIPGLRVLTVHENWQVREEGSVLSEGEPLWLGERSVGARYAA